MSTEAGRLEETPGGTPAPIRKGLQVTPAVHSVPRQRGSSVTRFVSLSVNVVLGALVLFYAGWNPAAGPGVRADELVFYGMVAVLFWAVATGIFFRQRWLIVIPAIPLFLASLAFALLVGVVGWQWDGSPAGAFAVSLFELFCIILARRVRVVSRS